MKIEASFQKTVGILAIVAGVCALLSLVVGLSGVDYDFEVFSDTSSLIAAGSDAAGAIKWSYWLNMVGNYLFLIPLALYLWQWLKERSPSFAQLFTLSGILYMVFGAAGSAILASAWPYLIEQYVSASAAQQEVLIMEFQVVNAIAETGLHGVVQNFVGAIWFLGMGQLLSLRMRGLGIAAIIIGAFLVVNTLGNMFGIELLSLLGLMANILLAPVWSIVIGVMLIRR